MNIFANTVVTISFKLFDASNQLIEESPEPLVYLHGGHSGIFPKIEEALNFKQVGESISVTLEPDDAFGEYDEKAIRMEVLGDLPPDVKVGGYLVAEQDGREVVWRVTGIADGKAVLLTPNHDNADPYEKLKGWAGSIVEVSGTLSTRGGASGIDVTGAKLAASK